MAKAVFIGDSYTSAASCAFNGTPSWADMVGAAMGWQVHNLALGGTGYITGQDTINVLGECSPWPGVRCPSYTERIADAAAIATSGADFVIVSGGRNELGQQDGDEWQMGVQDFYTQLRAATPARVLACSPIWDDDPVPVGIGTMRIWVAGAVAGMAGACYINLHDPLLGHSDRVLADGVHPSAIGQIAIKEAFLTYTSARCLAPLQPL